MTLPPLAISTSIAHADAARASRAGEDLVLLHLERGTYYTLNATGAFVWERCGDGASLGEVRDAMVARFEVDAETAWCDLVGLVGELASEGLLVVERKPPEAPPR